MATNYITQIKPSIAEIQTYTEIIKGSLYFAIIKNKIPNKKLKSNTDLFYFTTDDELIYQNYYNDFGPLNIACLYKFCMKLNKYLQYTRGVKAIVYYTVNNNANKKANATFLIGSYCIIYLKMQPIDVMNLMEPIGQLKPFLDASQYHCQFTLKMLDCYQAISKALTVNFFNFDDFNDSEYDLYNNFEFGDMNWLVPRKFLAFLGPADIRMSHTPEFYIKYFLKNDIKTIIRLNSALYDSSIFREAGIQHYDLIFPDGTTPPKDILLKFLFIAETAPAAIAVHCKAGLGRTGSLIGAYIIKHYRLTARQAIAWLRICRPGSVIGQQQKWLELNQNWLWRVGSQYRLNHFQEGDKIPRHRYGIYSKLWPIQKQKLLRLLRKSSSNNQDQLVALDRNDYRSTSMEKFLRNNSNKFYKSQEYFETSNLLSEPERKIKKTGQQYTNRISHDGNGYSSSNRSINYNSSGDIKTISTSTCNEIKSKNKGSLKNGFENPKKYKSASNINRITNSLTQGDKLNILKMQRNCKTDINQNYVHKQK